MDGHNSVFMMNMYLKVVLTMLVLVGAFVTPSEVASVLASDGQIGVTNYARINMLRAACIITGLWGWYLLSIHGDWRAILNFLKAKREAWPTLLFAIVCILSATYYLAYAVYSGVGTQGAEYLNIAKSLTNGEGFSVIEANRWMWYDFVQDPDSLPKDIFYPTVMAEPIYPYLLSMSMTVFGEDQFTAVLWLHVSAWLLSAVLWFQVIAKLLNSRLTAATVAGLLLLWPSAFGLHLTFLSPAPLAACFVAALAWTSMRMLEDARLRWVVLAGLLVGFGALTLATLLAFLPVMFLVPLFRNVRLANNWGQSVVVLLVAVTVIAPWSYRNYQVVEAFVPVRVGMGLISHQGNPVLAATFFANEQACSNSSGRGLWQSSGPRQTIREMGQKLENSRSIYRVSFACAAEFAPENYNTLNEYHRDAFYASLAQKFMQENPLIFLSLGVQKYIKFFEGWNWQQMVVGGFALVGLVIGLFNKNLFVLLMMLGVFAGPYALGAPWGYRYRFPAEGLMLTFAAVAVHWAIVHLTPLLRVQQNRQPND